MANNVELTKMRLDKWLWAARFFKTRNLATEAINGGKVHLNNQRTKPAKEVQIGDQLDIHKAHVKFTVIVQGLSMQRRPATEAALLFSETAESVTQRHQSAELRRQSGQRERGTGRPTKRERRQLERFKQTDNI